MSDEALREEAGTLVARASTLEQYQVADCNLAEWLRLEFDLNGLKPALLSASLLDIEGASVSGGPSPSQ